MNQYQNSKKDKKKSNSIIAFCFFAFFIIFIVVDICYIYISEKTWRGLETEDGYQKGLRYNQSIEEVKKQKKLGWNLIIIYKPIVLRSGIIKIKLTDEKQKIISNANLILNIKRPIQENKDFSLKLKFNPTTLTYDSAVTFPLVGQWNVEAIAKKDDHIFQESKRLIIN